MKHFNEIELPTPLRAALEAMGYSEPTPIQAQAIPLALTGRDILGSAQTGTGKTAAFGIPLIARLIENPESTALVLAPTRELAVQVIGVLRQMLARTPSIRTALLIGGEPMGKQFHQLRAAPRLVVGTPGRVCDHLNRRSLTLDSAGFFVLDEMDRMLDIGLAEQIEAIGRHLPEERQTMMFSATLPDRILKQAARYLREPERVAIGSVSVAAPKVKQEVVHMEESAKYPALLEALGQRDGSVIVFVKTRRGADKMADKLRRLDHGAEALHGDLQQRQRDRVIRGFRQQDHRILVATDIAARGLDIPHIQHVINFDLPQSPEDYIHRIGRTGRAGAEGEALCLIGPDDRRKWKAIQRLLNPEAARQEEREGRRSDGGAERRGGGRHRHGQSPRQGEWQGRPRQEREQGDGEARPFARRDGQRPSFKKADQPQEARRDGQRAERPFDASAKPAFGKPYAKDKNQAQGEAKPWKKTGEWKERKRDQDRPEKPWGEKPRSDKPRGEQTRSDKPWGEKPRGFSAKPYGAPQSKAFGRSRKAA